MEEIKIVINLKGDAATIGISKPGCDPIFRTAEGGLGAVMTCAGELVAEANAIWDSNPRYPKSDFKPEPPPSPQPTERRSTPQKTKPAQPELQLF